MFCSVFRITQKRRKNAKLKASSDDDDDDDDDGGGCGFLACLLGWLMVLVLMAATITLRLANKDDASRCGCLGIDLTDRLEQIVIALVQGAHHTQIAA